MNEKRGGTRVPPKKRVLVETRPAKGLLSLKSRKAERKETQEGKVLLSEGVSERRELGEETRIETSRERSSPHSQVECFSPFINSLEEETRRVKNISCDGKGDGFVHRSDAFVLAKGLSISRREGVPRQDAI